MVEHARGYWLKTLPTAFPNRRIRQMGGSWESSIWAMRCFAWHCLQLNIPPRCHHVEDTRATRSKRLGVPIMLPFQTLRLPDIVLSVVLCIYVSLPVYAPSCLLALNCSHNPSGMFHSPKLQIPYSLPCSRRLQITRQSGFNS